MAIIRKQYFVKPKIQLRYLSILAIIIVVLAFLVYYIFLDSLLKSPGMELLSAGDAKNFVRTYTSGFFWVTLIFMALILIESIFYFHRIIGPIYFFEKVMKRISEGDFTVNIHHRKKDETVELAQNMNSAIENIRNSVREDRKKIQQIKSAIDSGNIDEAGKLLGELTMWFKTEKAESEKTESEKAE